MIQHKLHPIYPAAAAAPVIEPLYWQKRFLTFTELSSLSSLGYKSGKIYQ